MRKSLLYVIIIANILFLVFFPAIKSKYINDQLNIKIINIASKDLESKGKEVWIDQIYVDEKLIDNSEIVITSGWYNQGRIFSTGNKKEEIYLKFDCKESVKIVFITHEYSGMANIQVNNRNEVINLYSKTQGTKEYLIMKDN